VDSIRIRLEGISPLIMHNGRLSNPLDPLAKEMKAITSKRKKTDDDFVHLSYLEFAGGMYFDEDLGPYVPGQNIDAAIWEAAKIQKMGQAVKRGLQVIENKIKLDYDGPRTLKEMWGAGSSRFVDIRAVRVNQNRCQRCRPFFHPPWSLEFEILYNPEVITSAAEIMGFLEVLGGVTGLMDGRPRYGHCSVKQIT